MSDHGLIRIKKVLEIVDVSKSSLYREIRDKKFPAPGKIRGCSCWPLADVLAFVKKREQTT